MPVPLPYRESDDEDAMATWVTSSLVVASSQLPASSLVLVPLGSAPVYEEVWTGQVIRPTFAMSGEPRPEMDAARQRYITVPFARLKTTIPEDNKAFSAQVVRLRAR